MKKLTPDNAKIGMSVTYYTGSGGKKGKVLKGKIVGFRGWTTAIVKFGKTEKVVSIYNLNRHSNG